MTIAAIKKKLHEYVENGDPKKIKLFYSLLEDEEKETEWSDEFVKELDRRTMELETGKVKGYTFEEMITMSRQKLKNKKKNGS